MLSGPVSSQGLQAIARKTCKVGEGEGGVEYFQSFPSLPIKPLERPHELAFCEKLGALVLEVRIIDKQFSGMYDIRQTYISS